MTEVKNFTPTSTLADGDFIAAWLAAETAGSERKITKTNLLATLGVTANLELLGQIASTGLVSGCVLSINGGDNTTFDMTAGVVYFVDNYTTPGTSVITRKVVPSITGQAVTDVLTELTTWIAVNSTGAVTEQVTGPFTATQDRDLVSIGSLFGNLTNLTAVFNIPRPVISDNLLAADLARALGSLNISGDVYFANATGNLTMDRTGGETFRAGANFRADPKNPNFETTSLDTVVDFFYQYSDGSGGITTEVPSVNNVTPDRFDDGDGTPGTVANNKFTAQEIVFFPTSNSTVIRLGTVEYSSLDEAEANHASETQLPISLGGVCRGHLLVKKGTTDLTDVALARFLEHQGNISGGGTGGTSVITVQDEGSDIDGASSTLDFVGPGVGVVASGATAQITIPGLNEIFHVQDQKSSATAGGTSSVGDNIRVLNTVLTNTITGASLASNKITLPAGTYDFEASAIAHDSNFTRTLIYNVTDAAIALLGQNMYNDTGNAQNMRVPVHGRIIIAAEKDFELRHYFNNGTTTNGLGFNSSDSRTAVFGEVFIRKVA